MTSMLLSTMVLLLAISLKSSSSFFISSSYKMNGNGNIIIQKSQLARIARHKAIITVRGGSSEDSPSSAPPPPPSDDSSSLDDTAIINENVAEEPATPVTAVESSELPVAESVPEPVVSSASSNEISEFQRSLPNLLTYLRCLSIPLLIATFYLPNVSISPSSKVLSCLQSKSNILCSVLFAVASFTDWLDGYLARKWNVTSSFGAFLDPVADKLMVSTVLILLSGLHGIKVALPTAIILGREISVSALREWMAQKSLRDIVKVGFWGKVKTALTMVSLTLLLWDFNTVALALLFASTVLTISSAWVYFKAAAPILMKN